MRSGTPGGGMGQQEEVERFLMQQGGGANPLEMDAMRRELENVAHRNNPLKGDRGELELSSHTSDFEDSKLIMWRLASLLRRVVFPISADGNKPEPGRIG
jgi:hypothetical protein